MVPLSFGVDTEYRTGDATHFMLNMKKETLERSAKRTLECVERGNQSTGLLSEFE